MVTRGEVEAALAVEDDADGGHLFEELLAAGAAGDEAAARELLQQGADARHQDPGTGQNALMAAAGAGHEAVTRLLLRSGVPWNAQDKQGLSAGDHAVNAEQQKVADLLLEWACLAEQVLRSPTAAADLAAECDAYLASPVRYQDGKLLDAQGEAVMMRWEAPLMAAHANLLCQNGGHILNVGFGMGLIDEAIQTYAGVASHTIVEAHPDVYRHMLDSGWGERPGVRILFGKWQDVLAQDTQAYDAIFFDTYSEHYDAMREFHALLPRLLQPQGLYSFFNGLAPRCAFFHAVYCRVVAEDLRALSLETQYMALPVDVGQKAQWDEHWEGVRNRYWFQREYNLPIVYWADT